jgi:hypothetical protein
MEWDEVAFMRTYNIFRGHYLVADALCVEAVEGLQKACDRMRELAAENPGAYFVLSEDHWVMAIHDHTLRLYPASAQRKKAGAA